MDLGVIVVEERVRAQNWLGFFIFFYFLYGYLIEKVHGFLQFC